MKSNTSLNFVLFVFGILGIFYIILNSNKKETFLSRSIHFSNNVNPGEYPDTVTKGLLYCDYPEKKNPGLSNYNARSALTLSPNDTVGNYNQVTNNKRYWETPCEGSSIPSNFCGGIYNKKKQEETFPAPPKSNCLRVNYYCSH